MSIRLALLPALLVALALPTLVLANGGTLRLSNVPMGVYRVSVFTDPTPVRPDSLDVSVLVLLEGEPGLAEEVTVTVRAESLDHPGHQEEHAATREQADDPRYHAAKFGLGMEGRWRITVTVEGARGSGTAHFEIRARDPGIFGNPWFILFLALLPLGGAAFWILREDGDSGHDAAPAPT